MRAVILAGACAAFVAGCGSHGPSVVAWIAQRPSALPRASAHCRASQLRPDWGALGPGQIFQGATGSMAGGIRLRNVSPRPCVLEGRPRVRFEAAGARVVYKASRPVGPAEFPHAWLGLIAGNREADISIWWSNWCDGATPTQFRITLASGPGSLLVPMNGRPRCDVPGAPSIVSVTPFAPAVHRTPQPWTRLRLRARVLAPNGVKAQPTLHTRRGALLRYRVEVTNASRRTLRFRRCPLLLEQLAPAGRFEVYVLNCRPVGELKPGRSAVFAMELRIPPHAPLGANGLFWELDPYSSGSPNADARVIVSR